MINFPSIDRLLDYEPLDIHYAKFGVDQPYLLTAGQKVVDTYYSIIRARVLLIYSTLDNLGDLSEGDEPSVLFTRSQMVIASLIEFNHCVDITWQIIWSYFQPSSLEHIYSGDFMKLQSACTYESVVEQLKCSAALHSPYISLALQAKGLIEDFNGKDKYGEVRTICNIVKHRGTIHIEGLGSNENELGVIFNKKRIPKLSRPSYNIDYLTALLLNFDSDLSRYLEAIVDLLFPQDYISKTISFKNI